MSAKSSIEWTDATWTPLRARVKDNAAEIAREKGYASLIQIASKTAGHVGPHCEHASPGCDNCYSETNNGRCLPTNGTGLPFDRRSRDLVDLFVDEKILMQPLHWRKPRRIFVCSQTDLLGEFNPDEIIDRVVYLMLLGRWHTFQVLTKQARRMREYFTGMLAMSWPASHIHLGVSVEDQQRADERIPELLRTPAAVRFLSVEPLLGRIDLRPFLLEQMHCDDLARNGFHRPPVDWVIVGGESGPGARPCNAEWIRAIVQQCKAAGVPVFVKQLGRDVRDRNDVGFDGDTPRSWPMDTAWSELDSGYQGAPVRLLLDDRKGGDPSEWPLDLRIREMPGRSVTA